MQTEHSEARICNIYRGRGEKPTTVELPVLAEPPFGSTRISANAVPLHRIMSRDVICARPDLDVQVVVRLMTQHHIGCIPVVDERQHPIGMITKYDILEQLNAGMSSAHDGSPLPIDLQARCADEVLTPLAFTLPENATVAHAAWMIMAEDVHHVIVVSPDGRISGIVSTRDIVGWLLETDGP